LRPLQNGCEPSPGADEDSHFFDAPPTSLSRRSSADIDGLDPQQPRRDDAQDTLDLLVDVIDAQQQ
jgi:hypothetical protein